MGRLSSAIRAGRRSAKPWSPGLPGASKPRRFAPGVDLFFTPGPGANDRPTANALRALFGEDPVDVVVQRASGRRKKLLVADMDSTMISQECIDELGPAAKRAALTSLRSRLRRAVIDTHR
jgi:phosphoserine phosphatase